MGYKENKSDQLLLENEELKTRLTEAEEALYAIRNGEVDAILVSGSEGDKLYSLSSAETSYRIILEELEEGVMTIGADGTILYCNNRFANIISQPVEKIVGSTCREYIDKKGKEGFDKLLRKGLKGKSSGVVEFRRNNNKSNVHLKLSLKALPSEMDGDVCIVASDVSQLKNEQEKLEILVRNRTRDLERANERLKQDLIEIKKSKEALTETELRYKAVYDSMSEGLAIHQLVYDSAGKPSDYIITDVNPAFERITKLKKDDTIAKKATEVYAVKEAPYIKIYSEVAMSGHPQSFETYFPPMNKHFHVSVFSQGSGKFATVFQDISERKLTEEKLQKIYRRFYLMLSSLFSGLLLITDNGKVEFINEAFCNFYSIKSKPEKLIGVSFDEILKLIKPAFLYPEEAEERMLEILREGTPVKNEEFELKSEKYGLRNFIPLNIQGISHGHIWVHVDITERRLADEALRKSEQLYRAIGESIDYGVWICDETGKNTYASDSFLKLVGQTQEECSEFGWANTLHPDDAERTIAAWKECARTGEIWDIEHRFKGVDGKWHPVLARGIPVRDFNGKIISWAGINLDISKIKQAEEALRESEERFRSAFKNSPDAITITRLKDGKIVEGNESVYTLLGYKIEDVVGKTTLELGVWADIADLKRIVQELISRGFVQNEDLDLIKKDGTRVPVNLSASLITINNEQCFISSFIDLTERKKAEEALRNSEERLRVTLTSIGDAVITVDTLGKVTFLNPVAIKLTGWKQSEAAGKPVTSVFRIINELTGIPSENIVKRVLSEGRVIGLSNHTALITKDDRQIPIEDSAAPIKDQSGNVIGVILVFHDVTEKRRAQEALKESEERFRNLVKNAPTAIYEIDFTTRKFTTVNDSMCQLSGYSKDELLSMDSLQLLDDESKKLFFSRISKSLKGEKLVENVEYKVIAKDGRIIDAVLNMKFTYNKQGIPSGALVVGHDITERKKVAEEIRKTSEALKESESILRISEQKLKYHLENSPLAVVEWDKDLKTIQWSHEAEKLFGFSREEIIGVGINELKIIPIEERSAIEKVISRLVSGKERKVISQNQNITKTGNLLDCIWYNSVLLDENGEMSSVMSLVEDITLLRRTERELMESRESYKELVTNARSMIIKLDNYAMVTFINEFALDFFGYKEEEVLGKSVMIMVPETDSKGQDMTEMVNSIIEDPDSYSININENIKKNGEKVWVEWHNKSIYDPTGIKTGHIAIGVDITKRRKAEEALIESERKLKSVIDAANESIYMFDRDGVILMSNTTGVRRLNREKESDVVGHYFSEFMTPELAQLRAEKINVVFRSKTLLKYEDERNSRYFFHNLYPVVKNNEVLYVVSYSTDITERKNFEANLRQSEDRFRTIAESLTVMISISKVDDMSVSFVNEPFENSFGFKKGELTGKKLPDYYFYRDDYMFLVDILKVKGCVDNMEVKVKKNDGTAFWIMTSIRRINFLNEPCYLTTSTDITETKKAQEELFRLNRTLDAQSKSSQAMMRSKNEQEYLNEICKIIIEDCGHTMVWVGYAQNDKAKTVKPVAHFGFDKGYIDQMNITWDDSERGNGPTGTAIKTGNPSVCRNMLTDPGFGPWKEAAIKRGYASSVVLPLKSEGKAFGAISLYSKDPDPFTESEIDLLSELADDLAYGIMFIRLSEYEKEATRSIRENELRLKELIATKDKFFNIIAHDLKNPFTSLLGASELLFDNINQMTGDNIKKLALILNDSAKSGYAILQNLLDWSRSQTGQLKFNPEKINLKTIVDENIENLQLQITNKEITLNSDLNQDLFINADKNMINTVLRNLLSNAVKYTFNNGNISVMVSREPREIKLIVKDSGIGMSKEKVESLFRLGNSLSLPGTAKEQGTGLGLKLCKEFTEKMGGNIWVESKVGKGSEFIFTIPLDGVTV